MRALRQGQARLGEKNACHHQLRRGVIHDIEKNLQGGVVHVEAAQIGRQRQQSHRADLQFGGEQQTVAFQEQAAVNDALNTFEGREMQTFALPAFAELYPGILKPSHQPRSIELMQFFH